MQLPRSTTLKPGSQLARRTGSWCPAPTAQTTRYERCCSTWPPCTRACMAARDLPAHLSSGPLSFHCILSFSGDATAAHKGISNDPAGGGRAVHMVLMLKQPSQVPGSYLLEVKTNTQNSPAAFSTALLVLGSHQGSSAALML